MITFNSNELLSHLKPVLKALGKTGVKNATITFEGLTSGVTTTINSDSRIIKFQIENPKQIIFSRTYSLEDVLVVHNMDKKIFTLELDDELDLLNSVPIFTTEPTLNEVGGLIKSVEVPSIAPYANTPIIPSINKLLKKSLLKESEYLLWRVNVDKIELCQIHPTTWSVRSFNGEFGANFNVYTNKLDNKLIYQLLSGEFKISELEKMNLFEDLKYQIYIKKQEQLRNDLYPPFDNLMEQKGG